MRVNFCSYRKNRDSVVLFLPSNRLVSTQISTSHLVRAKFTFYRFSKYFSLWFPWNIDCLRKKFYPNFNPFSISNSNWIEWRTIQAVTTRVISKSDEREGRENHVGIQLQVSDYKTFKSDTCSWTPT